jgi:hypothetical protein
VRRAKLVFLAPRDLNSFDWTKGFPNAMSVGGFDCLIGNPPWVSLTGRFAIDICSEDEKRYFITTYRGNTHMPNKYEYFVSQGAGLVKIGTAETLVFVIERGPPRTATRSLCFGYIVPEETFIIIDGLRDRRGVPKPLFTPSRASRVFRINDGFQSRDATECPWARLSAP